MLLFSKILPQIGKSETGQYFFKTLPIIFLVNKPLFKHSRKIHSSGLPFVLPQIFNIQILI